MPHIVVDALGRPTGFSAGDNERRWKEAVRSGFVGKGLPTASRVSVEVDYRLDPSQVGNNAPDLDNLLKATIDALDEVLGPRPGRFARAQADDERVDRIVASTRIALPDEDPGARMVVSAL